MLQMTVFHIGAPLLTFWSWFQMITLKVSKTWSKKDKELIFFFSESWDYTLSKSDIRGTQGGLGKILFWFEIIQEKIKIFFKWYTKIKIPIVQVPPRSPGCQIQKVCDLSFHWKKIILIALLDHFLQKFQILWILPARQIKPKSIFFLKIALLS